MEKRVHTYSGALMLIVFLVLIAACFLVSVFDIPKGLMVLVIVTIALIAFFMMPGFIILNPNDSLVITLFGTYKGALKENGFFWINPFTKRIKVSLKARNLNGEKLKVNDGLGNPIEIAAVIVWQVTDTYKAVFEVDQYEKFIITQSEAAVRNLAGRYPYDHFEDEKAEITLRSSTETINDALETELNERLQRAGITIIEARISHLAYAPEIAGAMLQRQQAAAVVAARQKIVEGAVGMVEMALDQLNAKSIVNLDNEKKAQMVANLLVVLCSDRAASPVVNTGASMS